MKPNPKECACGRVYDAGAWRRLDLVDETLEDDYERRALEHRLCASCGESLSVELPPERRAIDFGGDAILYAPWCQHCRNDVHTRYGRGAPKGPLDAVCGYCDGIWTLRHSEEYAAREPERLRARLKELKASCASSATARSM